jgi:hypothetical protein
MYLIDLNLANLKLDTIFIGFGDEFLRGKELPVCVAPQAFLERFSNLGVQVKSVKEVTLNKDSDVIGFVVEDDVGDEGVVYAASAVRRVIGPLYVCRGFYEAGGLAAASVDRYYVSLLGWCIPVRNHFLWQR